MALTGSRPGGLVKSPRQACRPGVPCVPGCWIIPERADQSWGIEMNAVFKACLSTLAVALALPSGEAKAVVAQHVVFSNSVNYCQAFTPGPSNTFRNRVIGSENTGATANLACNFPLSFNGSAESTVATELEVWVGNTGTAALTVSCTMLTGYQGDSSAYAVTKVATIAAGGQALLEWTAADNPEAGATDLGNVLVGINCSMPRNAVLNDTYVYWNADNGVEAAPAP